MKVNFRFVLEDLSISCKLHIVALYNTFASPILPAVAIAASLDQVETFRIFLQIFENNLD